MKKMIYLMMVLLMITSALAITTTQSDDDLGVITIKTPTTLWEKIGALFSQQAIYATPVSIKVGQEVKIAIAPQVDNVACGKIVKTKDIVSQTIYITSPTGKLVQFPLGVIGLYNIDDGGISSTITSTITFTPNEVGKYSVHYVIKAKVLNPTTLTYSICGMPIAKEVTYFTVESSTPKCNEKVFGDWQLLKNINGGKVEQRIETKFNPTTCVTSGTVHHYRTTCNGGYLISGTSNTVADKQTSCTLIPEPDPARVKTWVIDNNLCYLRVSDTGYDTEAECKAALVDYECSSNSDCDTGYECNVHVCELIQTVCTSDIIKTCEDGTVIVTKSCSTDGTSTKTDATCPDDSSSSSSSSSSGGGVIPPLPDETKTIFDYIEENPELSILALVLLIVITVIIVKRRQN